MLSSTYIKAVGHSIGYSRQLNNSVWQKNKGYEAKQTQRQIETAIRKQKDLSIIAGAAGDTDMQLQAQEKINLLANKYAKFSKAADLPTRVERLRVEGFRSVKIPPKPLTNAENSGIIKVSGAIYGALNPENEKDFERCLKHAVRYYKEIRKRSTDIEAIAHNTGFDTEVIKTVKQHIFYNKYDLGEFEPTRFDPSYDIAVSWQNMISGKNIDEKDIILIKHEYYEYQLMHDRKMSYIEAHKEAESKYNYRKAVDEWRAKK